MNTEPFTSPSEVFSDHGFHFSFIKSDFTAPNGVTYTWDAVDNLWRVKAFLSQNALVTVGDTPPSDPKEGDLWYNRKADDLSLYVYVDGNWVSATPLAEAELERRIALNESAIIELNNSQSLQDGKIRDLELSIEELQLTKGLSPAMRFPGSLLIWPPATVSCMSTTRMPRLSQR